MKPFIWAAAVLFAHSPLHGQAPPSEFTTTGIFVAIGAGGGTTPNLIMSGGVEYRLSSTFGANGVVAGWATGISACEDIEPSLCDAAGTAFLLGPVMVLPISSRIEVAVGVAGGAYRHRDSVFAGDVDGAFSPHAAFRIVPSGASGLVGRLGMRYVRVPDSSYEEHFGRALQFLDADIGLEFRW